MSPSDTGSRALPAELESAAREVFASVWQAGRGGARRARDAAVGAIEGALDRIAKSVVDAPLDVRDAEDARRRIDELTAKVGNAATIVGAPWLVNRVMRFARRGRVVPSTAVITAAATTFTAVTAGLSHLRVLGSLLVQRLRANGYRVDPAFVRRVAVALYLDPSAGTDAVRPNRFAALRLATDWGTHAVPFLGSRRNVTRVHRAAEAIDNLDLEPAIERFERDRAIDLRATARSD